LRSAVNGDVPSSNLGRGANIDNKKSFRYNSATETGALRYGVKWQGQKKWQNIFPIHLPQKNNYNIHQVGV